MKRGKKYQEAAKQINIAASNIPTIMTRGFGMRYLHDLTANVGYNLKKEIC